VSTLGAILNRHQDLVSSPKADRLQFMSKVKSPDDLNFKNMKKYYDFLPEIFMDDVETLGSFEQSTSYFSSWTSMNCLKQALPNVKIVILIRDPADRAYIEFQEACRKWKIGFASDGVTVEYCPDLEMGCSNLNVIRECNADHFHNFLFGKSYNQKNTQIKDVSGTFRQGLLYSGEYDKILKKWEKVFRKDQIFVTAYENIASFKKDSSFEMKRLRKFLNLKDYKIPYSEIQKQLASEQKRLPEEITQREPINKETRNILNKIYCDSNYNLKMRLQKSQTNDFKMPEYSCIKVGDKD